MYIDTTLVHCSTASSTMLSPLLKAVQASVTAKTLVHNCSPNKCTLIQHLCTAALLWAQCTPHCSWLPCKLGSQQASVTAKTPVKVYCCCFRNSQQTLCHSNSTYRDMVFIQVCSDPTPVVVLQHCAGQNAVPNVLCCCTRQAHSMRCVMHYTYVGLSRCAGIQHQCTYKCAVTQLTAARFRAKGSLHCSVLLCKTGSEAGSVSLHLHIWRFALHTGVQ